MQQQTANEWRPTHIYYITEW